MENNNLSKEQIDQIVNLLNANGIKVNLENNDKKDIYPCNMPLWRLGGTCSDDDGE